MKRVTVTLLSLFILLLIAGCGTPTPSAPRELRVMTYSSFDISEETVTAFEEAHNVTLQFLDAGDTGQMLNQAILNKDNPPADVMYGLDNTFLSRALEEGIFVAYEPENLKYVPERLHLDATYHAVPIDYGDVCLNYDKAYLEAHDLPAPQSLQDLTEPQYEGMLVVENPASSSPGLAFLIATIGTLGQERYLDFWDDLRANDVLVVEDWSTAYYNEFSGGAMAEGIRPLVVSYATSPAAEVYFSEGELEAPPTGAVTAPGTCFRQVEFVGILKNGQHRDLAEAFVEFVLSDTFQSDIPLHMWVFPANSEVELPPVFQDFAVEAQDPVQLSLETIGENREAWITAWSDTVLR